MPPPAQTSATFLVPLALRRRPRPCATPPSCRPAVYDEKPCAGLAAEAVDLPRELVDLAGQLLDLLAARDVEGGQGVPRTASFAMRGRGPCAPSATRAWSGGERAPPAAAAAFFRSRSHEGVDGPQQRWRRPAVLIRLRCEQLPDLLLHRRLRGGQDADGLRPRSRGGVRRLRAARFPPPCRPAPVAPAGRSSSSSSYSRHRHFFLLMRSASSPPRRERGAAPGARRFFR